MNMLRKIIILCVFNVFLHSIGITAQSQSELDAHVLKLDWEYKRDVPIYENRDSSKILAKVGHLYEDESPIGFLVQDTMSVNGWLKVQVYWEDRIMNEEIIGYIHLEKYIVITPKIYQSTPIFESPYAQSPTCTVNIGQFSLSVQKYFKGWVYVSFYDASNKLITGWIAPYSQCPLMFTTCN